MLKLIRIIIRNFRSYKEEIQIPIDDFTAFVGKNDVGKSTILEALEIFFNNTTVKIEQSDACVYSNDKKVMIGCVFSDLPDSVILDTNAPTNFDKEYLLNSSGELEIHKVFDCNLKNPKETVYVYANHPTAEGADDLIQLKNDDLKNRARKLGIDLSSIDQRSNPELREAIRNKVGSLQLKERLIPLNGENGKTIWQSIAKILPYFALFQADRPSKDEDSEVQDPMKYAIKEAIKSVEEDLERIKETVHSQVLSVAERTLDKLRQMDPALASELTPHFKSEPKWDSLFKLSLTSDDQIPVNKRGSGVRRLILLNFFRAEVERKQAETNSHGVIYAIEEPETSQHPSNQKMLIEALIQLSQTDNCQVIITTHVPGLAGLINVENLRYVEALPDGSRQISYRDDEVYKRIADQLGVLPDSRIKVFVCVEGPNDIKFLTNISRMLHKVDPSFPDLGNEPRIAILPLGGSTLKDWVRSNYLRGLGIPEVHIYDRDEKSKPKYMEEYNMVNKRGDGSKAFITGKREMENYLHPDAIKDVYGFTISFSDMDDVPELVAKTQHELSSEIPWDKLSENKKEKKISKAKARLNDEVASRMTYEQLCEVDPDGDVKSWLKYVKALLEVKETQEMSAPTVE